MLGKLISDSGSKAGIYFGSWGMPDMLQNELVGGRVVTVDRISQIEDACEQLHAPTNF